MLKYSPSELHTKQTAIITMRDTQICDNLIGRLNDAIDKHLSDANVSTEVCISQLKNETRVHMNMVLTQLKTKGYNARIASSYDEDIALIINLTSDISVDTNQSTNK